MKFKSSRVRQAILGISLVACFLQANSGWALSSYATDATDEIGSTGSSVVALGVPDYEFVNDAGIGFAGNTDVFDVGEAAVFTFPVPLREIAGQHDLVISAYVGGLGETDNAHVQVEVSDDGTNFTLAHTFNTDEARNRSQDFPENDHAGVKHFWIDFNGADNITHVRLTNLAGTAEGLRLDSIEGLHPVVDASHAFEIRFARYRPDFNERFHVQIKNTADEGGVSIREFRINRPSGPGTTLEHTDFPINGLDGDFICIENCIPDNGPLIPFTRMVWSTDGTTEAAPGLGLDPGKQASQDRWRNFDLDTLGTTFLSGYTFTVTFADGLVHAFDYDADFLKSEGQLYQKYLYHEANPVESWPRPVDYYEWRRRSLITFSDPPTVGTGHEPGSGGRLFSTSQTFIEDGMHVESFWVPNDESTFVQGHFHDLHEGFERSHAFESTPGLGPDRLGFYLERVDGGPFDLESLDYRVAGGLQATNILISPTYDPALPVGGQFTEFPVVETPERETLEFSQFDGVTTLFILADLNVFPSQHRVEFDDLVIATTEPITIPPTADAGPDLGATDDDDDGLEMVGVDGGASFDPDGTIASWSWLENGSLLGTGVTTDLTLAVGDHDVTLEVIDDDGNADFDTLQIRVNPPGGLPFADAGPNQNGIDNGSGNADITLDGSGSFDSHGSIVAWDWSESGVPLGSAETLQISLPIGTHVIDLQVTDDSANTASDTVTITINPQSGFSPIANAGANVTVTDVDTNGAETVTLDGSASTDPDGIIVSWDWSENGLPLGSGETLPVSFDVGVHSVDLVVTDDSGFTAVASVTITVESGIVIQPVAYVAHQTSAESANTTSHTLSVDTLPITAGDLLVAHICSDGPAGTFTCPTGWTNVEQGSHTSDGIFGAVCVKQADLSDETATSYEATTSSNQQSQSGVILFENQDTLNPVDVSSIIRTENDISPESPALTSAPLPSSTVVRFMCANGGQVTEGVGFPAGMVNNLWIEESNNGFSGPASGGAAIDALGVSDAVEWTSVLATSQQSVGFTVALAGRAAVLTADAGPDAMATDIDEDGSETFLLDGSGSSDFDGTIIDWRWSEGGTPLGSGETLSVSLSVGTHDIDLEVEDNEGNLATDTVQIIVNLGGLIPPIADAGPDQSVADVDLDGSELITLDGSASSDSDGFISSWTWTEGGSPLATGQMPTVALTVGSHIIDLEVVDDDGNSAFDSVVIAVQAGGTPPVADAGPDQSAVDAGGDGFETVTLDGSASSDSDGTIIRWSWSESGTPLGSGEFVNVSFAVGTHLVDLEIEDDGGLLSTDTVSITVTEPGASVPAIFLGFETSEETANATTHTLNVGTLPIATGDLMLAQICSDGGGSTTITCPSGWSEIENSASQSSGVRAAACYREATVADESATSYSFTTSASQQTQSGVMLFAGQDSAMPIESSAAVTTIVGLSPESPAFVTAPSSTSTIVRMACANGGQVSEGIGFPDGMVDELWILESNDGFSGPVSAGAAIDVLGAAGSAVWTDMLATAQQTVGFSIAINGGDGAPIPNAGSDAVFVDEDENGFENVLLDGSGSFDSNGSIVSWTWAEGGAPLGTGETLSLALFVGIHDIDLEVEDDEGNFATDSVTITVVAGNAIPPVADAGADVLVIDDDEDLSEVVTLDGSGSFDPDGSILTWTWSEGATLLGTGESVGVSFGIGSHVVDLVVEDDDGNTDSASVTITVAAGGGATYVAHETSFESSNTMSHSLNVGTLPIAAGDLLVAHICVDGGGSAAISCPVGWTQVVNRSHQSGGVVGALCTKQADTSDESATNYTFTTTANQQSQSGVLLMEGHDAASPVSETVSSHSERSSSPASPALDNVPDSTSLVLRFACSNGGQVTEGVGFPSGMGNELWLLESANGGSGPVAGGAAIDLPTASGPAVWTDMLATPQQSVTFSISIRADGAP